MKIIKRMLKNIVFSTLTIYSLNLILIKLNIIIPINYFSIIIVSLLGFPGLIMYISLIFNFYR